MIVSCGLSEAQDCLACGIDSCTNNNATCLTTMDTTAPSPRHAAAQRAIERRRVARGAQLRAPHPNMCCATVSVGMTWALETLVVLDYQV